MANTLPSLGSGLGKYRLLEVRVLPLQLILHIMKKLIYIILIGLFLESCQRSMSPYRAASTGGKKCGSHSIR